MPRCLESPRNVHSVADIGFGMAGYAEVVYRPGKLKHRIGGVRVVAVPAHAGRNRRVDGLFCEHSLVVAGIAQVRLFGLQEFSIVRRMRIMARRAHPRGDG